MPKMFNRFPWFGFTPVIPQFYWDVKSAEERIKKITMILHCLGQWAEAMGSQYDETTGELETFEADVNSELAEIKKEINSLKNQMNALAQNALIYDVTTGLFRPSIATARRVWQADHATGMLVSDLASFTVEQASEFNVRHVSTDGRVVYMQASEYEGAIPMQAGYSVPCFVPNDYVKKSDLTYIDSDNLQERVIMGVLDTDAASDLIKPTAYVRPYVAHDLVNTWVRFDDQVIADFDGVDCIGICEEIKEGE